MLRVPQHQPLTCMRGELTGQLIIANRKQEFFRDHAGKRCQQVFAFPGLAKPSSLGEFLQQASALTRRIRPTERNPGVQAEYDDQRDQYGKKSNSYFFHVFQRVLMNSITDASRITPQTTSAERLANVNHEAIFHIAGLHALIGEINILHRDNLDIGDDLMLPAKIQHFLRLFNPTYQ